MTPLLNLGGVPQTTSTLLADASPDDVSIHLGPDEILTAESWNLHEGVLEVPGSWSLRCGWSQSAASFISRYPPGSPFALYVAGALQASGRLDAIHVDESSGATEITMSGRDALAPLFDTDVDAVQNFTDTTYSNLVWRVLSYLGLVTGPSPDPLQLASTNDSNRQVKAGKPITVLQPPRTPDQILEDDSGETTVATQLQITAKPGERWMSFLRRYLDPAGLVLWAAANGTYVLSVPNVNQSPLYRITKQAWSPGKPPAIGIATGYSFKNDVTHRHSAYVVYGRGGGRKSGVAKVKGGVSDDEMTGWGYTKQARPGGAGPVRFSTIFFISTGP
jgi:hypothetical protein